MQIEIDNGSGFCFGVTTAIRKAEEELAKGTALYCLGDIVHNGMECERLKQLGLITIDHEQMAQLHDVKVLLRAHGEPPETYDEIIDATCPVVLQLQKKIKKQYEAPSNSPMGENPDAQSNYPPKGGTRGAIVIFGKPGHAEVMGLVGQTGGNAIVIAHFDDVMKLDFSRDIYLYSQTTKSLDEFHRIIAYIQEHISPEAHSPSLLPSTTSFSLSVGARAVTAVCSLRNANGSTPIVTL